MPASGAEGLEMVCVALRESTVGCNVSGANEQKLPCYPDEPLS